VDDGGGVDGAVDDGGGVAGAVEDGEEDGDGEGDAEEDADGDGDLLGDADADADLLDAGDAAADEPGGTAAVTAGLRNADADGPSCTAGVMPPDCPVRCADGTEPADTEGDVPEAGA
jgi:hypothetical protein